MTYRVSYALAGNFVFEPVVKTGDGLVNGQVHQRLSFDTTGATREDMNYTKKSFLFLATGFAASVEFVSQPSPRRAGGR